MGVRMRAPPLNNRCVNLPVARLSMSIVHETRVNESSEKVSEAIRLVLLIAGPYPTRRRASPTGRRYGDTMTDSTSCAGTVTRAGTIVPRFGVRFSHRASVVATSALAILFRVAGSPAAVAQPAATPAGSRDELRSLSANSIDITEGKQLAQRFCADCHGAEGISTIPSVPDLAGQRANISPVRCTPTCRVCAEARRRWRWPRCCPRMMSGTSRRNTRARRRGPSSTCRYHPSRRTRIPATVEQTGVG